MSLNNQHFKVLKLKFNKESIIHNQIINIDQDLERTQLAGKKLKRERELNELRTQFRILDIVKKELKLAQREKELDEERAKYDQEEA